jgi:hypothetical protein
MLASSRVFVEAGGCGNEVEERRRSSVIRILLFGSYARAQSFGLFIGLYVVVYYWHRFLKSLVLFISFNYAL